TIQVLESTGTVPQMAATLPTDLVFASLSTSFDQLNINSPPQGQIVANPNRTLINRDAAALPNSDPVDDETMLVKALEPTTSRFSKRPQVLVNQDIDNRLLDKLLANDMEELTRQI